MDAIETLPPGTPIRLTGDHRATVEENPRDGAWLLARCRAEDRDDTDRRSVHGVNAIGHRDDEDLVVVHADDILDAHLP